MANCIKEVVILVEAELKTMTAPPGTAPHPADIVETPEDAEFVQSERNLKLGEAVAALRAVASAKGRDELHAAMQELIAFACDPKTLFILEYDDIKHPKCWEEEEEEKPVTVVEVTTTTTYVLAPQ